MAPSPCVSGKDGAPSVIQSPHDTSTTLHAMNQPKVKSILDWLA